MAGSAQQALADTTPYMGLQGTYGWQAAARHTSNALGGTILFGFPTSAYFAPDINLFGLQSDRDYTAGPDHDYGGGPDSSEARPHGQERGSTRTYRCPTHHTKKPTT